jgi:hypothetical protein
MGINPTDPNYFNVNMRRKFYRLAGLPMAWSLSPFYFSKMTLSLCGAMTLPFVDDFLQFTATEEETLTLRKRLASL